MNGRGWRRYSPIGVDLGTRLIKAAQWVRCGGQWRLHARAALERRGPLDAQHLAELDDLLYRQGFGGRRVVLGLPRAMLHTAVLELPPRSSGAPLEQIAHAELARMHRLEASSLCTASWDLPQPPRAVSGTQVMAVACAHADSEPLLDLFEARGFVVEAADSPSWALARGCRRWLPTSGLGAVVDFGWSSVGVCFVHEGVVVYDRSLPDLGLGRLQRTVGEALAVEPEVAEHLLLNVGLEPSGGGHADRPLLSRVGSAIEAQTAKVAEELRVALDYVAHRYSQHPLTELLAVGGGAAVPRLCERVAQALERPVKVAGFGTLAASGARGAGLPDCLWPAAIGLASYDGAGEEAA